MAELRDFVMQDIDGASRPLVAFEGKVVLVVNVASRCGLTPQYEGLQRLYDEYRRQGLEILAFPCNQFAGQEPGGDAEVKEFACVQYGVGFPLFSKIDVNGKGRAPLYAWLCAQEVGPDASGDVEWNFAKFLIGRDGRVIGRFSPRTEPCSLELRRCLEEALA